MTILRAHFDGRAIIPDEPVDLPVGAELTIRVEQIAHAAPSAGATEAPLLELLKAVGGPVSDDGLPSDLAAQHDHYLYGTRKRP